MKGGSLGLRSTKLSFILITLVCTTLVMWGWDKAPFLVSLLPRSQSIKLSPDIFIGSPLTTTTSEPLTHENNNLGTSARNETIGKGFDLDVQSDSAMGYEERSDKDILISSPTSEPQMHGGNNVGTSAGNDTIDKQVFDLDAQSDSSKGYEERGDEDGRGSKGKKGNALVQMGSTNTSSVVTRKEEGNSTYQVNKQACNYAKGKWVADERRPFYSGGRCRQWLSEMWACRLTNRIDFAYEQFRWQPQDCEVDEFSGNKFLRRMRNKTLAFIGDSLGRQQFQSLMCMVTGGKERSDVINVGWEYGLVKGRHAIRPDGWAYRFTRTNTTILFYWSACLCDLQEISKSEIAMHLDRPPAFLSRYLDRIDVLVLNTGHHWNRGKVDGNHWVMHAGGVPTPGKSIEQAKNLTIHSIVKWVDSQLPHHPKLRAFYRSISPRHFFNGDWNTGGSCDNTNPLSKGKEVLTESSSDPVAAMAVKGTNVSFLDITALSELRDEGHISKYTIRPGTGSQDCLHWCLPGIPDTWNEILFAQLFPFTRRV